MRDSFSRIIEYLRISLTDRCNFRCRYCMPPEGICLQHSSDILTYEELLRVIRVLSLRGVTAIRLTGGEPLVRKGLIPFIRNIHQLGTITDLSMTTNGSLLSRMAQPLKSAGLDRVNISLDTLDADKFRYISGGGNVKDVLNGIDSALAAKLTPVKLNVVLTEVLSRDDIDYFISKVLHQPVDVRFIEYMPIGYCQIKPGLSIAAVKSFINSAGYGRLEPTTSDKGNGPARYYQLRGAKGKFGFITPISDHFCNHCNRMRLTAEGKFKPCLLGNHEFDIKPVLRSGGSDQDIYELFQQAVREKPARHQLSTDQQHVKVTRRMFQVGG